jgi:hypothetical protein
MSLKKGATHDVAMSDDEAEAKIIFKWVVCGSVPVMFGFLAVAFGVYLTFSGRRK